MSIAAAATFAGPSWRARRIVALSDARETARAAYRRAIACDDESLVRIWHAVTRQCDAERFEHAAELIGRGCAPRVAQ